MDKDLLEAKKVFQQDSRVSEVKIIDKDNGIGIMKEDIPYIFNRFYRGDKSRNYKIPGSGLGLSTCKYVVEKHLGEIYFKAIKDGGSRFYFSIPLSEVCILQFYLKNIIIKI